MTSLSTPPTKYLSVCSGIEAATVAWEPLGWEAVGFSEIEAFPRAVLSHRYPHVPLHGDFTALIEDPPLCDVLVGGTPCQAFSVAGARRSLDDARGNLSLAYVELANAIDRKNHDNGREACITVWENVPGVFSTKDNAFGCFLRGLAGSVSDEDGPLEPPGGKWTHCGVVLGPQRAIAWRVLDAQYFGLAQRRRRVFVVASAREGFDPSEVLLEWEGVRRDSAPSREARKEAPAPLGGRVAERDGRVAGEPLAFNGYQRTVSDVATPLMSEDYKKVEIGVLHSGDFAWPQDVADPLTTNEAKTYTQEGSHNFRTRNVVPHVVASTSVVSALTASGRGVERPGESRGQDPLVVHVEGVQAPAAPEPAAHGMVVVCPEVSGPLGGAGQSGGFRTTDLDNNGAYIVSHAEPFAFEPRYYTRDNKTGGAPSPTVTLTRDSKLGDSTPHVLALAPVAFTTEQIQSVMQSGMVVRRLTPRECERLQGFPDDYTIIPWRGKPCPDGPRYKALGNSMAVPVMRWIGRRIDEKLKEPK